MNTKLDTVAVWMCPGCGRTVQQDYAMPQYYMPNLMCHCGTDGAYWVMAPITSTAKGIDELQRAKEKPL